MRDELVPVACILYTLYIGCKNNACEYNLICMVLINRLRIYGTKKLLLLHYNSSRVFAFSTISLHVRRSWTCSVHFISFIFLKSFLMSSPHQDLDLPTGLLVDGFHLHIFLTILVSGILFMCPNQLNLWALT